MSYRATTIHRLGLSQFSYRDHDNGQDTRGNYRACTVGDLLALAEALRAADVDEDVPVQMESDAAAPHEGPISLVVTIEH